MKIARFFAGIFGILGGLLMLGTVILCLTNLNAPVRLGEIPAEAAQCAQSFAAELAEGDFSGASQYVYGQPDLGAGRESATPEGKAVWEVYRSHISWEFQGSFYGTSRGLARKAVISTLDIASMTSKVAGFAGTLMNEAVAAATAMEDLYDENNNFRQDLIDSVMRRALEQALAEGADTLTQETTLELVFREGKWWVLPDQALLTALQGGL